MTRPVMQVLRFYIINKTIAYRSIDSLLKNPNYNPYLKLCVETMQKYPEWTVKECNRLRNQIDNRTFKFNSGSWAMDVREEDIPKGTSIDWMDLKIVINDIKTWAQSFI